MHTKFINNVVTYAKTKLLIGQLHKLIEDMVFKYVIALSKDVTRQDCGYAEKCSQSTFRSMAELSLGSERISEMAVVDMVFLLAFSPFIYLKKVVCQKINLFIFTG